MAMKIDRTRKYDFIGDVYEYHGQDRTSTKRTHTDCGWRLRSYDYRGVSTFAKLPLSESLLDRPCPLYEGQSGVYIFYDSIFPQGFYIGKSKDISDRIWKHMVKLDGTEKWNKGVDGTVEFEKYRQLRLKKGLTDFSDVQVAFFFTELYDRAESEAMCVFYGKYQRLPFCNSADETIIQVWDI